MQLFHADGRHISDKDNYITVNKLALMLVYRVYYHM